MRTDKVGTGSRARANGRAAGNIDAHVGERIRTRRRLCGWSQQELAAKLGISSQQLQKYEAGINRISASRLFECSQLLDVPVSSFFEGLDHAEPAPQGARVPRSGSLQPAPEAAELLRVFAMIEDSAVRSKLVALLRAFAAQGSRETG